MLDDSRRDQRSPAEVKLILPTYLGYRGKAQPVDRAAVAWHPVAYHSLDHAACVAAILDARPRSLSRGASLLGVSEPDARQLLVSLGALHDIGKFSESFFGMTPALWPDCLGAYENDHPALPHTISGYVLWQRELMSRFGQRLVTGSAYDLDALVAATFGHHGRPLARGPDATEARHFRRREACEAAIAFADDVIALISPSPVVVPPRFARAAKRASWWVAGLIEVADWLSSDQRAFAYAPPTLGLAEYWISAAKKAAEATARAGLRAARIAARRSFPEIAKRPDSPTPTQAWAIDLDLPNAPTLFIIEDVTGSGKTEAAQVLIHHLMTTGASTGAYWGMPTQATASAMFARQRDMIGALFELGDIRPSIVLAHGQSRLHEGFRSTVFDGWGEVSPTADDLSEADVRSEVACATFIADDRRKSFLADVGAGSIDQALLGILPTKHNTMRLFGLADKVLVLDEVHAYDAYVSNEIAALLQFHAVLRGSAILLSATLPAKKRDELVDVWRRACGGEVRSRKPVSTDDAIAVPYPLATVVGGGADPIAYPIEAADWSKRSVTVVHSHDVSDILDRIISAHRAGQAVAWIRNTVESVIDAAQQLEARGMAPVVFHARFAQCDRQAIERRVVEMSGPESSGSTRNRVVVGSQVIEQSLDLDFDLLISDLAPIDLLIQRAGRLWRHRRGDRPASARMEMVVLSPPFEAEPSEKWPYDILGKTKWVYNDLGVLWRTQRALIEHPSIDTPSGVRSSIETVYADGAMVPSGLQKASSKAYGDSQALGMMARNFSLDCDKGYAAGSSANWYDDIRVPTRLTEERTVIRLARVAGDGSIEPWAADVADGWKAWAFSEVRVSDRQIPNDVELDPRFAGAVDRIRSTWPKYEQSVVVVVMQPSGVGWTGTCLSASGAPIVLDYLERTGLRVTTDKGA